MLANILQYNEMAQGVNPMPFLTNNPSNTEMSVMAESNFIEVPRKSQARKCIFTCKECGGTFTGGYKQIYCTPCRRIVRSRRERWNNTPKYCRLEIEILCKRCNKAFLIKSWNQIYCSKACRCPVAIRKPRIPVIKKLPPIRLIDKISKEKLNELYVEQKSTIAKCAIELNIGVNSVSRLLKQYNIPTLKRGHISKWAGYKCQECGKEFISKGGTQKYCSRKCYNESNRMNKVCETCGKIFTVQLSFKNQKYCSRKCVHKARKGVRIAPHTEFKKGVHYSIATEFRKGENMGVDHPNWKGGLSSIYDKLRKDDKYKIWRNQVYVKDYWTCQECGIHCEKGNIIAHHIEAFKDYPELRFDISNGITLCRACHLNTHRGEMDYAIGIASA